MSDRVLFHMWGPFRSSLIAGHQFYVEQAQKRLFSQFEDISAEAENAAKEWLDQSASRFDPDHDDPENFYENANEVGIEFYSLLSGMRDQTRLSVVAGMFHEWDKQLREWLVREIQNWHWGEETARKVWSATFAELFELFECLGWETSLESIQPALDACRLVVNVYKHGKGVSLEELKQKYPEYLENPFGDSEGSLSGVEICDHTHLKVNEKQFQMFSDGIVAFWNSIPERTKSSDVKSTPSWLEKALSKDRTKPQSSPA